MYVSVDALSPGVAGLVPIEAAGSAERLWRSDHLGRLRLCVYDGTGSLALQVDVAAGGTCGSADCWKGLGTKGYKFLDKTAAQDGMFKILLKGNAAAAKTKILIKGKDGALTFAAADPLLDTSGAVSVRVTDTDNANCWGADFAPTTVIKNTAGLFKAKSP